MEGLEDWFVNPRGHLLFGAAIYFSLEMAGTMRFPLELWNNDAERVEVLARALEAPGGALLVLDALGNVVFLNAAAERACGGSGASLVNRAAITLFEFGGPRRSGGGKAVNSEGIHSRSMNSEAANSEATNFKATNSEATNFKAENSEAENSGAMNFEAAISRGGVWEGRVRLRREESRNAPALSAKGAGVSGAVWEARLEMAARNMRGGARLLAGILTLRPVARRTRRGSAAREK